MNLLQQIKRRRLALGLKQKDMQLRIGMNRQQYQRLEASGNPRLDTLQLIAQGLDAELLLIPNDLLQSVKQLLEQGKNSARDTVAEQPLSEDPWKDLLDKS